jgi:glycerophosphoryl diester phosphodiesterase
VKRHALSLSCLFVAGTVLAQEAPRSDWTIRGRVAADKVVVQCHRGAGQLAPENTLEAFELGWTLGTWPEADLRTTRDGVIVTFHDGNFSRVVKDASPELKKKGVADLTWGELSALDVGEGRHVTTLEPVFERMKDHPERHLYLDIKNVDLPKLAAIVKSHGVEGQVVLASTNYALLRKWKALAPASGTLLWMGGTEEELRARLAELRETKFADVTQLQVHVRVKPKADVTQAEAFTLSDGFLIETGRELRAQNILYQSLPWGAADPAVYARLLDLGVMSFATDFPKQTLEAVRRYAATDGDKK